MLQGRFDRLIPMNMNDVAHQGLTLYNERLYEGLKGYMPTYPELGKIIVTIQRMNHRLAAIHKHQRRWELWSGWRQR